MDNYALGKFAATMAEPCRGSMPDLCDDEYGPTDAVPGLSDEELMACHKVCCPVHIPSGTLGYRLHRLQKMKIAIVNLRHIDSQINNVRSLALQILVFIDSKIISI